MQYWRRFWGLRWLVKGPIIGFAAVVLLVALAGGSPEEEPDDAQTAASNGGRTATTAATSASTAAATAMDAQETAETQEPTETPTPEPELGFGDGIQRVGSDIEPGIYRTDGNSGCYWERLSGFSGALEQVIANGIGTGGPEIIEIAEDDAGFNSARCGDWRLLGEDGRDDSAAPFEAGTYRVGEDVAPGQWAAPGGGTCYWERLSGFSGTLDDVIANALPSGRVVVDISSSDVGFRSQGCGEWSQ